jgi:hypothetical protein
MKILIIGGTCLIGTKTAIILRQGGHDVAAVSPRTGVNNITGVNTITGDGLKKASAGVQVVIDLANSSSFEDKAVLECWSSSRPPAATFSRPRSRPVVGTTLRSPSSASTGCPTKATVISEGEPTPGVDRTLHIRRPHNVYYVKYPHPEPAGPKCR